MAGPLNHSCCFQPVVNTIALANDIELNPGPLSSTHNSSRYSGVSQLDTSLSESSLSSQHVQNRMPQVAYLLMLVASKTNSLTSKRTFTITISKLSE